MWHEARKQERKIRGMLVDYRKRAERRRDFYEKIKADPTQFLQVHGRQSKISLDPSIAAAADSVTTMMPWQGHQDNLIDRFDVRAHLDFIPPLPKLDDEEPTLEDRQLNYERYRIIAQNSFLQIGEEKFLKQLHLEEQFGYTEQQEPKKKKTGGVAIGFNYEDGTGTSQPAPVIHQDGGQSDSDNSDGSDSDLDVDLSINVSKVDSAEAHEMNRHGRNFGMSTNDFYSFLTNDLEEAENFRLAKEEENEKALFAGRKSRRERRAHREKRLANRKISPPSYAAQVSPTTLANAMVRSKSPSHSPSPEVNEKITYITSFGGDEEPQMPLNPTYADKVKFGNKIKKPRRNDSSSEERLVFCEKKASRSSERYGNRRKSPSLRRRSRSYDRAGSRRSYQRNRHKSRSSSTSSSSRSRSRRSRSRSMRRRNRQRSSSKSLSRSRSRSGSNSDDSLSSSKRSGSRAGSVVRAGSGGKSATVDIIKMELGEVMMNDAQIKQEKTISPPKAIPRYYGRRRSDRSSSSELGVSSDENGATKMDLDENPVSSPAIQRNLSTGNASTSAKVSSSGSVLSLQERLKRKRQALLNKQFKADKIAEQLKTEREKQEQQTREDELREMAIKLRRKQRERRHAYDSDNSSSASSTSSNSQNNSNPTSHTDLSLNRNKSRSKSPSSHSSNHKRSRESSRSKSTSISNLRNRDRDRDLRSKSPRDSRDNIGRSAERERANIGSGSKDRDRRPSADRDRNGRRSSGDRDRESRNSRLDRTDWDRDRDRGRRSRSMSRSRRDSGWGCGRRGRDDRGRQDDSRSRRNDSRGGRYDRDRDGRDWNRSSTRLVDY